MIIKPMSQSQSISVQQSMNASISNLYEMQAKIYQGLEQLDTLNDKYKNKQEKTFINTFLRVMDRMSNQLEQAHQNYKNIDKQISADKKCTALVKQLQFFKTECMFLRQQFQNVQNELKAQKKYQQKLICQNQQLSQHLTKKCMNIEKYRSISQRESIYLRSSYKQKLMQTIGVTDNNQPKTRLRAIQSPFIFDTKQAKQDQKSKDNSIFLSQIRTDRHRKLINTKQVTQQMSQLCHTSEIKYKSSPKKKGKGLQLWELTKHTIL